MLIIFKIIIIAFTVYLIVLLEKWKQKIPPKTLAIKYSTILVEVQIFLSALSLLFPIARWINAGIAVVIGLGFIWYFPKVLERLDDEQFKLRQRREQEQLLRQLKTEVDKVRTQKLKGCPMGLDCKQMGFKGYICDNFKTCDRFDL